MLKRSNAYELLALAYQVETPEWINKMHGYFKKLTPSDFQSTRSCVFIVDQTRVTKLHDGGYKRSNIIVTNHETGTVLLLPPAERFPLDAVALTLSILQTLYELRIYSAYFRVLSVKTNFGLCLLTLVTDGLPGKLRHNQIGWKVLQLHFATNGSSFKSVEQPHLQYEDITVTTPLSVLAKILPSASFWNKNSVVFMVTDTIPISMHLLDVVVNASNQLPQKAATNTHLQQELWDQLSLRYLQHYNVESAVIEELTGDSF